MNIKDNIFVELNPAEYKKHPEYKEKLLIITPDQFGYHIDTYQYAKWLREFFEISFYCWDYDLPKVELEGVSVHYVSRKTGLLRRNLRFRMGLLNMLNGKFDLVFIKYFFGVSIVHLAEKQQRLVCDMRTGNVRLSLLERFFSDIANYVELITFRNKTFISRGLADRFRIRRFHLLPLGANPFPNWEKSFEEFHLLYVGTFSSRRIEDTVRGFGLFYQKHRNLIDCRYEIVGSGTKAETVQILEVIREFHLEEVVTLRGYVPHEELPPFFQRANIGISYVPMTPFFDCQPPTKTFEYLQSGMVVLATATREHRAVIDEHNGVLIEDSPVAFALGLEEVLRHSLHYNSQHIQQRARQFSWENIVKHNLYPYLKQLNHEPEPKRSIDAGRAGAEQPEKSS